MTCTVLKAMPLPNHSNSPRLVRDALVLGPSAALDRDPTTTPGVNNSSQTVPQVCVPQESATSQPPRLVSRNGQLQEQGFSVEVAERTAAPQRSSTRTIYKSKWALFEKWCIENSVENLGPVVAAQQVLDPSPQTSLPRKQKNGHCQSFIQVFGSLQAWSLGMVSL